MSKVEFHKSQIRWIMDILQKEWVLYGSYFLCKSKVYRKVLGIKIREYPRAERSRRCGMSRFPHWYSIHIVEPGVVTHNLPAAQLRLPPAVHTSPAHTTGTLIIMGTGIFCRNVSYLSFFTGSPPLFCQKQFEYYFCGSAPINGKIRMTFLRS